MLKLKPFTILYIYLLEKLILLPITKLCKLNIIPPIILIIINKYVTMNHQ